MSSRRPLNSSAKIRLKLEKTKMCMKVNLGEVLHETPHLAGVAMWLRKGVACNTPSQNFPSYKYLPYFWKYHKQIGIKIPIILYSLSRTLSLRNLLVSFSFSLRNPSLTETSAPFSTIFIPPKLLSEIGNLCNKKC